MLRFAVPPVMAAAKRSIQIAVFKVTPKAIGLRVIGGFDAR